MPECFFFSFSPLDGVLTFEQMAACCWHNWVLRGNFPSGDERKKKNQHRTSWRFQRNFAQHSEKGHIFQNGKRFFGKHEKNVNLSIVLCLGFFVCFYRKRW